MFGFLKDKIKSALGKFTKEVEKDAKVETKEILVEKPKEKPPVKKYDEKKKVEIKEVKKEPSKKIEVKSHAKPVSKPTKAIPVSKSSKPLVKKYDEKKKVEIKEVKKEISKKEEIQPQIKSEHKSQEAKTEEKIVNTTPEKKKGFFQRLFSKSEDTPKESEDIIESKEDLRQKAESIDIEPVSDEKGSEDEQEDSQKKFEIVDIESESKTEEESQEDEETEEEQLETTEEQEEVVEESEEDVEEENKSIQESEDTAQEEVEEQEESDEESREEIYSDDAVKKYTQNTNKAIEIASKLTPSKEKQKSRYEQLEEERSKKVVEEKQEESKGFFTKITETFTKIQITEDKFEELFWELEVAMLENNVAVEVIDKIKRDLKKELMAGRVSRASVDELIASTLKKSIIELFDVEKINLIEKIKSKKDKPYIISIIGVNGSGKTTSIAKLAHKLQREGLSVVLAASDTFRAAAIQQLEEHANRLNVKMIKHDYNSDPAAVAFDAINYAKAKNIDVVLIDTAGRLHSNTNLMRELEKIIRVCKPDIKIFVGESITGNDCVEQAKEFDKAVGIDAIILAKADIDDKGGAAISVSYILQRPILYLGTGQTYDDLKDFDSNIIVNSLGL